VTLPELAIRRHVTTLMILVSLVVLGGVALTRLPLAFLPEVEEPQLFVILPWDSASPEQVERMVVRPVEDALGSVKGLDSMWSRCGTDGGRVRLGFDWGTDLQMARVEVWEKIDRIRRDLPEDLGDIQVRNGWGGRDADRPVLEGRLSSVRDLSESYDLLERKILRPLERVPGVASVELDGVEPKEVRVNLHVDALERHRIDVRDVATALRANNLDQSLGHIRDGDTRFDLRTVGSFRSVEEIRALPLRDDGLRLQDVADVVYAQPPLEYGRHLDGDFAVGITVAAEANANVVEVGRELKDRIAAMADDPELEGVSFLVWFSQSDEIVKTLKDLAFTGVFGAMLAAVVLFVFLRRVSTTIVSVMCIPFSLIVACGFIWAKGGTLNTLTLLGLIVGIGMLVDNAVVVIENIFRQQEKGLPQRKAALIGAREVATAVTAATMTTVIVFLPMVFNKPSEINLYLKELGITVCVTLLASLFVSQTLIPMATSWFIRSKPRPKGRALLWLERHYSTLVQALIGGPGSGRGGRILRRAGALVLGGVLAASGWWALQNVDKNFDTDEAELFVQIRYDISEPVSLERKRELVELVEAELEPHREELMARSIYSFWSDRFSLTRVYLEEGLATPENLALVRSKLRDLLPEVAGVEIEVQENRQFWRQDRGKRIAFQLVGQDSAVLARLAEQVQRELDAVPGLRDPFSSNEEGQEELHVIPDRDLASRYGVPPQQMSQVIGLTYRGQRLPRYRTPQGEREMRLTLDESQDESVDQLMVLPLWTADGEKVPLGSLADVEYVPAPERIQRDDRLTSLWVGAEYDEGTRGDYMPAVTRVLSGMEFPYGYSWQWGRWQQRQEEQANEILTNIALALLLVFALMAGLFESVRQAVGLMIALPFALSGGIWCLYLFGADLDIPAVVGFLLLIGVVVNNGIVMIEHVNGYRRKGMERDRAIVEGGRERLRPILMTAMTTLIGLVPIVVEKPAVGGVYYHTMALVLMGGLAISTLLTTLLLPVMVVTVEDTLGGAGRTVVRLARSVLPRRRAATPDPTT
jgi:HAE1 family hydrophobic/amphiphilic exporter-1